MSAFWRTRDGIKKQEGKPSEKTTSRPTDVPGLSGHRVSGIRRRSHDGEGGREGSTVLSGLVEKGKGELQGWFKSPFRLYIHTRTHTYCPDVSASADWGLTIHRKVNKLLSVYCRGLHCPLASHPCMLQSTHCLKHTGFLTISPHSLVLKFYKKKLISLVSLIA